MQQDTFAKVQIISISPHQAGQRIDNFLITRFKGVPKSRIYRILRKGEVRVNKKRVKPDYKLNEKDQVRLPPIRYKENQAPVLSNKMDLVQNLEERILYEDDKLIILNKPAMLAVHGGSGLSFGVIEAMRALRPKAPFLELVHRLDKATSGCLLIAKKRSSLRRLHQQLRDKSITKTYQALCLGHWPKKMKAVNVPLLKSQSRSGERHTVVSPEGKEALTRFKPLIQYDDFSLIEAQPVTGRTHQIRVHAQYAGHPLVGDDKYGDQEINLSFTKLGLKRLFLHASSIEFRPSEEQKVIHVEAPLDTDLKVVLEQMK